MIPRLRRSVLYMPGANARALDKARALTVDALIFDLEDAVAPEAKGLAREQVVAALGRGGYAPREAIVRVNALGTPWGHDDIKAVAKIGADAILLPKVETPEQVIEAVAALDAAGAPPGLSLWITIETPRGVLGANAIAAASPRVGAIVVGTNDLAKDLRVRPTVDRRGLLAALSACVLAARAHGLAVLDGVHADLDDEPGLRAACEQGRDLGFDGKTLIHPRQIAAANAAFAPGEAEIVAARAVVAGWERAQASGQGVCVVDGRMVERLHVDEALRTLALAAAIEAQP
ncbi:citrate lyase subunit beta/citryl-CoA lyase [Plasticicumulans lactativorans]|uniref:Citrate lyase subunit beta/citryl-CoA lyase n=1 Tax=Plasticicumulans lactativorans TaxID=1133106 RepID=A0A4R2KUN1_9GAMM|nr:CoA ester lyase [Plasticicumulans lactativorans]TCO78141.1 citrate lyase subunit beta/citryl-CoA lyase [Plasticicumulans lactativorans]